MPNHHLMSDDESTIDTLNVENTFNTHNTINTQKLIESTVRPNNLDYTKMLDYLDTSDILNNLNSIGSNDLDTINDKINDEENDEKNNKLEETNKKTISTCIDINDIFWDALMNNKIIIFATLPLFIGYYLQDTIFTRSIAEVTSNVPKFIADVDAKKIIVVMLPYIIALILFYVSNVIMSKSSSRIELSAVQSLTNKLIESIKTTKKPINVNDIILHIKKVGDTKHIYNIVMTYILPTLIVAFGLIYNFTQADGYYGLIVAIIMIVMMLVTIKLEIESINHAYNTETSVNVLYDEIHEIMTNIDSVLTSNTHTEEIENLQKTKNKTYDLSCMSTLNNSNTTYGLQAISICSMLGINYMSYKLYDSNKIPGSLFTTIVLMSLLFMDYYNYCIHAIADLINSMGRFREMREYFKDFKIIKLPDEEQARQITLKFTKGDIDIKDLTLKYDGKIIFSNFNLYIEGGTIVGLIGPIGSGKTTLLKVLAGILEYKGDVLIDNQPLVKCTYESIVEIVAYIPQHPKLFNKSIYYNINYGSCYTKNEILKKLEDLGLMSFINSFPQKLDTIVGKEGSKVSGGQKQFIAFIRALIQNKSIFLLDEPSSSLDITNKNLFIKLIKNIKNAKNKTIIISTHDRVIMPLFNRIIDVIKIKNDVRKAKYGNILDMSKSNNDQADIIEKNKDNERNLYEQDSCSVKMYGAYF